MLEKGEKTGWLWSRHAALALVAALATVIIDQAHKWWMLDVYDIAVGRKG